MQPLFDYPTLAANLNIPQERLHELESCVRRQYGSDEMMIELRLLRTLKAVQEGALTLDEAIAEFRGQGAAPSPADR